MLDVLIAVGVAYLIVRAVLNDRGDNRDFLGRPRGGSGGGHREGDPPKQVQ